MMNQHGPWWVTISHDESRWVTMRVRWIVCFYPSRSSAFALWKIQIRSSAFSLEIVRFHPGSSVLTQKSSAFARIVCFYPWIVCFRPGSWKCGLSSKAFRLSNNQLVKSILTLSFLHQIYYFCFRGWRSPLSFIEDDKKHLSFIICSENNLFCCLNWKISHKTKPLKYF